MTIVVVLTSKARKRREKNSTTEPQEISEITCRNTGERVLASSGESVQNS